MLISQIKLEWTGCSLLKPQQRPAENVVNLCSEGVLSCDLLILFPCLQFLYFLPRAGISKVPDPARYVTCKMKPNGGAKLASISCICKLAGGDSWPPDGFTVWLDDGHLRWKPTVSCSPSNTTKSMGASVSAFGSYPVGTSVPPAYSLDLSRSSFFKLIILT